MAGVDCELFAAVITRLERINGPRLVVPDAVNRIIRLLSECQELHDGMTKPPYPPPNSEKPK